MVTEEIVNITINIMLPFRLLIINPPIKVNM